MRGRAEISSKLVVTSPCYRPDRPLLDHNPNLDEAQSAMLGRLIAAGVPFEAIAFYGHWWQFERWLRDMVYLELRAKYGANWSAPLGRPPAGRAVVDESNSYMASADAQEIISYADISALFDVIDQEWELFAPFLPPQTRWNGAADTLGDLRNRNAHCRRPHRDDLGRIEQALRDLEPGAWRFYATFAETDPNRNSKDPLIKQWIVGKHDTARRLLKHAANQYDTTFSLKHTTRPWANPPGTNRITGCEGVIWKAHWLVRGAQLHPAALWERIREYNNTADQVIFLELTAHSVTASFSALEDAAVTADAIGNVFDSILEASNFHWMPATLDEATEQWQESIESLPTRVHAEDAFTLTDPYNRRSYRVFGGQ